MKIDAGDFLVVLGFLTTAVGLYLFDWRLVVIFTGALLMFTGIVRLRYNTRE